MPVGVTPDTRSRGEMRVLKAAPPAAVDGRRIRAAHYVVDRAFRAGTDGDDRQKKTQAPVMTRLKSTLVDTLTAPREMSALPCHENGRSDPVIDLQCAKPPWRRIEGPSPDGIVYPYLRPDFSREPGVIRWDEEK